MGWPRLSVVIPAYNEERRLARSIPRIVEWLRQRHRGEDDAYEIVVVDDGSTDGTARVVEALARDVGRLRLVSLPSNRGKGAAVRAGVLEADGDLVLFTDADLSTPIEEADRLIAALARGYGMACGSRAAAGASVEHDQGVLRDLAGKLFGLGTRLLVVRGIADTQCGFKAMTRDVAQLLFKEARTDSAIFDVELLLLAARRGVPVVEIPVRWRHDPDTRIPYDLRRSVGVWLELLRIRRAHGVRWPARSRTAPPT
jgi:glycosyltransferase involved in cell wall biosynthesis